MSFISKKLLLLLAVAAVVPTALGFSLLGPFMTWQAPALGYQQTNDLGGPMYLRSYYRWNVTNVTYAFDQSFIDYFGTGGISNVDDAFRILNSLPNASALNIDDYPLNGKLWNPTAEQAGLLDLKSYTLAMLVQYMGLADPERYVWTLNYRGAVGQQTNYHVISMNYDPLTLNPTNQVNGVYYTYRISEVNGVADAVEYPVTATDLVQYSAVAGGHLGAGYFYTGLTRDDVGGIKYLLSTNNLAVEGLLPNVYRGGPSSSSSYGWIPYFGGTNVLSNTLSASNFFTSLNAGRTNTTNFYVNGIRGGVNKVWFTRVEFDNFLGNTFSNVNGTANSTLTNYYTDYVIVTNKLVSQPVYRVISRPDIVFYADHLGFVNGVTPDGRPDIEPVLITRTAPNWINNDALNGGTIEGGPGVISTGAGTTNSLSITFTSDLGGLYNYSPYYLNEGWSITGWRWASFDQTTRPPVIYPTYDQITIDQLLALVNTFTNYTPVNTGTLPR